MVYKLGLMQTDQDHNSTQRNDGDNTKHNFIHGCNIL